MYHLKYFAEEDRLLISVDVAPAQEYAMMVTRRLLRQVLEFLSANFAKMKAEALGRDPSVQNTVLNFEHRHAVDEATATGDARKDEQHRSLIAPPLLVREIKVNPKPDGGATLSFYDGKQYLTVDLTAQRVHVFIAAVLDIAATSGWDFPPIATWLDRAAGADPGPAGRVMH